MSSKAITAVVAVVCAAGAFAVGRYVTPAPSETEAPPAAAQEKETGAAAEAAGLGTDAMMLANARRDLEAERTLREAAQDELAQVKTQVAELEAAVKRYAESEHAVKGEKGPRYTHKSVGEALNGVDWAAAGQAYSRMGPLLVELRDAFAAGEDIPSSVGDLSKWNGELIKMALEISQKGIPGTGVNGTFTHPSVMANMVHAALIEGGKPLDEDQARRLAEIGDRYIEEDGRRLAGYDELALGLQKAIDEGALKDRFFADVDAMLTEEQREILHPESVRGRLGLDLLSSGIMWSSLCQPVKFQNRDDLGHSLASVAMARFNIAPEHSQTVQELAVDWARAFPSAYLAEEPDQLLKSSMDIANFWAKLDRIAVPAQQTLAFYRALLERLPADSAEATRIRATPLVAVPVLWPKE